MLTGTGAGDGVRRTAAGDGLARVRAGLTSRFNRHLNWFGRQLTRKLRLFVTLVPSHVQVSIDGS